MITVYMGGGMDLEQRRSGTPYRSSIVAGMSQIVPAGADTRWTHRTGAEFISLELSPALLAQLRERECLNIRSVEIVDAFDVSSPQIALLAAELQRELTSGGENGNLYAECLGNAVGALLLRHNCAWPAAPESTGKLSPAQLRSIADHIEAHLGDRIELADLAALSGLGPRRFARAFRNATGTPIHQYVIRRRVERARLLLMTGRWTIAAAAHATGFYDQSHLTRHMRRQLGLTPSAFLPVQSSNGGCLVQDG